MDIIKGIGQSKLVSSEFLFPSNQTQYPWCNVALAAGTLHPDTPVEKHPGQVIYKSHVSNTNSGGGHYISPYGILISGGLKSTIIFRTGEVLTGVTRRMGFHDTVNHLSPTDGVYCLQNGDQLTGQTMNNSTGSTTGTAFTLATNTWYRLVIELNDDASLATYTLYADDSMTVLWTDTLATNIPTALGRHTGHGDICTLATSTGVVSLGVIDYMDIVFPNTRRVV